MSFIHGCPPSPLPCSYTGSSWSLLLTALLLLLVGGGALCPRLMERASPTPIAAAVPIAGTTAAAAVEASCCYCYWCVLGYVLPGLHIHPEPTGGVDGGTWTAQQQGTSNTDETGMYG
jgi:hypothetical protein